MTQRHGKRSWAVGIWRSQEGTARGSRPPERCRIERFAVAIAKWESIVTSLLLVDLANHQVLNTKRLNAYEAQQEDVEDILAHARRRLRKEQ